MGEKDVLEKIDLLWENWISACKKVKLGLYCSLYTKINSKLIKGLTVRNKALK